MRTLDFGHLSKEQIREFMDQLGFVETSMAGEEVWLANLSVSIRVNTTKPVPSLVALKTEIYKRVAYHRDEFLKQLDSILLFCLSDMTAFDARYTKQDTEKRIRLGIDQVKPHLIERKKPEPECSENEQHTVSDVFDL